MLEYTEINIKDGKATISVDKVITYYSTKGGRFILPFCIDEIKHAEGFSLLVYEVSMHYTTRSCDKVKKTINRNGKLFYNDGWKYEDNEKHEGARHNIFFNAEEAWLFYERAELPCIKYGCDRYAAFLEQEQRKAGDRAARAAFEKGVFDGNEMTYIFKSEAGIYKIGHSKRISQRLKQVSTVLLPLQIYMIAPTNREREIHELFMAKRLNDDRGKETEFFNLDETDIKSLEKLGFKYYKNERQ